MDFQLLEEQRILKATARDLLEEHCPVASVLAMEKDEKGYEETLWRKMADLGWMALVIPEVYEGVGGGLLDLVLMLEEMGRVCLPGPFFSTVVLGALPLLETGDAAQKQGLLPGVARGEKILTLAYAEPGFTRFSPFAIATRASPWKEGLVLEGTKLFVTDAHVADLLLCVVRTSGREGEAEGLSLVLVDPRAPGVSISPLATIAGDKQCEVRLDGVAVPREAILGETDQGAGPYGEILRKAALCKCAEMVGGAQKVLDMASAYAREREQFGRPIGAFQAVQHHCANMLMDIEGSRHLTYKVAWAVTNGIPAAREISACKAFVGDAFKRVVLLGHQILGATGYMIEHAMPLYSRRARVADMAFGDGCYHRALVARELGL